MREHGDPWNYPHGDCRCQECTYAWKMYCRDRKKVRDFWGIPERVHGTPNGYRNYGCRCDRCKAAVSTKKDPKVWVPKTDAMIRRVAEERWRKTQNTDLTVDEVNGNF